MFNILIYSDLWYVSCETIFQKTSLAERSRSRGNMYINFFIINLLSLLFIILPFDSAQGAEILTIFRLLS